MNRWIWILLLVGVSALSVGCGSARKARQARKVEASRRADSVAAAQQPERFQTAGADTARPASSTDTVETAALDPAKASIPAYILSLHGRTTPFQTFSGKARMEYESGDKLHEFTATFRIRRDSAIWISATAAGGLVGVARVLITPDSFFLVNHLQRQASRMRIEDAAGILPLPARFSTLQALLLGDVLEPSADITSTGKAAAQGVYYVSTRTPSAAYTAYYMAGDTTLASEEMVTPDRTVSTSVVYSDYDRSTERKFSISRTLSIDVVDAAGTARHVLRMNFTDPPRFDGSLDFSFSIPKNYTLK